MVSKKIRHGFALLPLILAAPALAQDTPPDPADAATAADESTLPEAGSDTRDEAITILDQTVPVADELPPDAEPVFDEQAERAKLLTDFVRFQELREGGSLDEAENLAKQMVETSIRLTGPTSRETGRALNNLAVVQYATDDYDAAQQNFSAAIEIIEDNEDQLSEQLINPLTGLGAAQLGSGRPDLAAQTFGRAVHISHVNEGPHNLDQVNILESLAETNLMLGDLEQARQNQDMIYALTVRHFEDNAIDMVPSLLRRATWQRRTGYILDERATYRRIIRIIEDEVGEDDIALINPLLLLGDSYNFPDTSTTSANISPTSASGEMYFKRAIRIAEENPEAGWEMLARAKLGLADYYNFRADIGRARKNYAEVWNFMSADEDRLAMRSRELEELTPLNASRLPRYVGEATARDRDENIDLREGRIIVSFDVNNRGRVSSLEFVEADPEEFTRIRRMVQREMRTRIYRPRVDETGPVDTPDQVLSHTFFYRQDDLEKLQESAESED